AGRRRRRPCRRALPLLPSFVDLRRQPGDPTQPHGRAAARPASRPGERMTSTDVFDGIRVIDCAAHFTEPADLWTSRAAGSMEGRMPEQRTIDGRTAWFLDGQLWASTGGNTIAAGRQKQL